MATELLVKQIEQAMAQSSVPGVAAGIVHGDQEETIGLGVTNVNHPLPVTTDTLFQIGSISKTMTATVVMRLVEMEKLDLDLPVRHYLPTFRLQDEQATQQATVRHLFIHTGGWLGDYFENTGRGEDALARYVANMADLPQLTPFGTLWSYNNAAFSLAGRIIEVVTGKPFETAMHELLFAPLGMNMSFYFTEEIMTHRFVAGHTITPTETTVATPWALARSAHAAGGVIATIDDMVRYARFHLQQGKTAGGEQLVAPATIQVMHTKQAAAGGLADAVGISWLLNDFGGTQLVSHGGATNGQIAQLTLVPAHNFALAILTNANRGREVTRDLSNWILQHYLGLHQPTPQLQQLSANELEPYCGYYTAKLSDVEVTTAGGGLVLQVIPKGGFPDKDSSPGPKPPPAPAAFFAEDRVIVTEGPTKEAKSEFGRDAQGQIAWIRVGGRIHRRQ
jgi:CubicO group peptidase (beta-lactamase class C family)